MLTPSTRTVRRPRPLTESLEGRLLLATTYYDVSAPMNIFDSNNPPTPPALNFPSAINVDSVPAGAITELRVSLRGVYHTRPQDLDVLVVSPTGKSVILMSDAGGSIPLMEEDVRLVFTDAATRTLPQSTKIAPGLYRPTDYDPASDTLEDFFIENELINAPTHTTLQALAADNPVGMWRLYVVDDQAGQSGGVGSGWGLTFVTGGPGPAAPSTPDMHPATDTGVSNSDNITRNSRPVIRGTAPAGAVQVRLFVDGIPLVDGPVTNGNWAIEANGILEGTHAISARSLDANGTEGPPSADLVYTFDPGRPNHPGDPDLTPESDTGASNTDNDTTDTTPTFTGTVTGGADFVTLLANGTIVGTGTVTNNVYTVTPTEPMAPGTYDFAVFASDTAGNVTDETLPGLTVIIRPGGDNTPTVTAVYVRGSTWAGQDNNPGTTQFMEYLEAKGLGDDVMGYRVDNLAGDAPLPWINLDQIVLRYSAAPTGTSVPTPTSLTLAGLSANYTINSVSQVPGDAAAYVLTLGKPLGGGNPVTGVAPTDAENGDRITLRVPGGAAGGGLYSARINVLQGDTDHLNETADTHAVLARDFAEVKKKFFKDTTSAVEGTDTDYSAFHDVDGSGSILARDFAEVKKRFFQDIPPATAAAAGAGDTFGGTFSSSGTFSSKRVAEQVLA